MRIAESLRDVVADGGDLLVIELIGEGRHEDICCFRLAIHAVEHHHGQVVRRRCPDHAVMNQRRICARRTAAASLAGPAMAGRAIGDKQLRAVHAAHLRAAHCDDVLAGRLAEGSARMGIAATLRGNRAQVGDHGTQVLRRHVLRAVLNHIGHRAGCVRTAVHGAGGEILREFIVRPVADARVLVRRDVVGVPARQFGAAETFAGLQALRDVARRMAFLAMRQAFDQIRPTIPLGALLRVGHETPFLEVEHVPEHHQPALVERKRHLVARRRVVDRRERVEIGADGEHIAGGDFRVVRVRERRIQPLAALADTLVHRAHEIGVGPSSNPRVRIARDIRRVDGPERRVDGQAAGEGAGFVGGMTRDAIARAREIFAALDQVGAGLIVLDGRGRLRTVRSASGCLRLCGFYQ
ncbi:hypothetical protein AXG89_20180 [Burkholderia sp. PAMC 26561]|nr:hypothetical protein AXG89_20180 [Burkholderia sp. PAMC 26561]